MPSLHIKLRLLKNLVKAVVKNRSNGFESLFQKFPKLSQAMLKEEILVVPQISVVLKDQAECEKALNTLEQQAWNLNRFAQNFLLKNFKSHLYLKGVAELLAAYKEMGCRMSLKMHFLNSHLV